MEEKITQKEWIAIAAVLVSILSLISITCINRVNIGNKIKNCNIASFPDDSWIEITVAGAVEQPGVYLFRPGVSLKEVIKKAKLNKEADRKKLNGGKIFYLSEKVEISSKNPSRRAPAKKTRLAN